MSTSKDQLVLFDHYNPLQDRLGKEFFDAIPKSPGIYKMYDRQDSLLYIGKSVNLRQRLFSYKNAKKYQVSSKIIRLIRQVQTIEWQEAASDKEARILENRLLRAHNPPFNSANTEPHTYYFVHLNTTADVWQFWLTMRPKHDEAEQTFGAFKGHRQVRQSLGSLLRLLYFVRFKPNSVFAYPLLLNRKLTPYYFEIPLDDEIASLKEKLIPYLSGKQNELVERLNTVLVQHVPGNRFYLHRLQHDLEQLELFFYRYTRKNRELGRLFKNGDHLVAQDELDDMTVRINFSRS